MNDPYEFRREMPRMPRWMRLLWLLVLLVSLLGGLLWITTALLHHVNRINARIVGLVWSLGFIGLLCIGYMWWSIYHPPDEPSDW